MSNATAIQEAIRERKAERREVIRVIAEIIRTGTASATLSNASGTKTYTRLDLQELRAERTHLSLIIQALQRRLRRAPLIGNCPAR